MSKRRKMEKDLIERVGKPAIRVPEGYFEGLGERLGRIPSEETVVEPRAWMKLKPYLALAACFAIAFAIGTAILKTTVSKQSPDLGMEDEDGSISEEDIINYLIDTGVSAEQIEFERQEE